MSVIKQVLVGLKSSQVEDSFSKTGKTSSTIYGAHQRTSLKKDDLQTATANPIVFVSGFLKVFSFSYTRQSGDKFFRCP